MKKFYTFENVDGTVTYMEVTAQKMRTPLGHVYPIQLFDGKILATAPTKPRGLTIDTDLLTPAEKEIADQILKDAQEAEQARHDELMEVLRTGNVEFIYDDPEVAIDKALPGTPVTKIKRGTGRECKREDMPHVDGVRYRQAWRRDANGKVFIDMEIARKMQARRIMRYLENKEAELTAEETFAPQQRANEIAQEKQALRNSVKALKLHEAKTPEELKSMWPVGLEGPE